MRRMVFWFLLLGYSVLLFGCGAVHKGTPSSEAARSVAPQPTAEPKPAATFSNTGGMWLPEQMAGHALQLKELGLRFDAKLLTDFGAHPLAAVIFLGGCSASFVSSEGLIVTNHHCAVGALQHNSTPAQNLVEHGYLAATRADEKSNGPSARVYVTERQSDVTREMTEGLTEIADDRARYLEREKRQKALVSACERRAPHVRCLVSSFFEGARYLLIERLELKDVRLVYAPASGIGNYGGEVDNWQWPRHAGDFTFYRAYVAKDGKPAEYSSDNVPYRPRDYLKIAQKPLRENDLVFVAGYPAHTETLAAPFEIDELVSWYFPRQIQYCEQNVAALERASQGDADATLRATPTVRGLNNAKKSMQGSLDGLGRGGVAAQKREQYVAFRALVQREGGAAELAVLDQMEAELQKRSQGRVARVSFSELLQASALLQGAIQIVRFAKERQRPDAERKPDYQERNVTMLRAGLVQLEQRYSEKIDVARLTLALNRGASEPLAQGLPALPLFVGKERSAEAMATRVRALFKGSQIQQSAERLRLFDADFQTLKKSRDSLIRLALALLPTIETLEAEEEAFSGRMLLLRPRYVALLQRFVGRELAPDANRSLRLTYGTVKGYRPSPDKPLLPAFTTLSQVVKKHTGAEPFNAPAPLREAIAARKLGPYVDAVLGDVPVDFVADLHITGGNSGSPTLDADGNLVGLAFDGNYEAMASNWVFMPELTRSIHVDMRYVLWLMDAVDHADHLLRELGLASKVD